MDDIIFGGTIGMTNSKRTMNRIALGDTKLIVYFSSKAHKSISYLDLNILQYSYYKKTVVKKRLKIDRKNMIAYRKYIGPSFDLELPSENIYYKAESVDSHPYSFEDKDKYHFINGYCVEKGWFEKNFQKFVVLFLKQTKEKRESLEKFFKFANDCYAYTNNGVSISHCFRILCIECQNFDSVKGLVLAITIGEFADEPQEVIDYFLYHNCKSKGYNLPLTVDFGQNIIRMLKNLLFYRFVPHLLKCGFSPLPLPVGETLFMNKKYSLKRYWFIFEFFRIHSIIRIRKMKRQEQEMPDNWMPVDAREALTLMWRCIPDALLSQKEIAYVFSQDTQEISHEKFTRVYESVVGAIPALPTPRSLKHYSRLVVRNVMAANMQLPHGISTLDLPLTLESFLRLES